MHLERVNEVLTFFKKPRIQTLPLQFSTFKSLFQLPIWSRGRVEPESQGNFFEDSIFYNPVFKLPNLEQLSRLYYHTIYESNGSFAIVDFAIQLEKSESGVELTNVLEWLKEKSNFTVDQVESYFRTAIFNESIEGIENDFLNKWKLAHADNLDADVLSLRVLETTLLLKLACFSCSYAQSQQEEAQFYSTAVSLSFEELMELSEGIGLLRALQPVTNAEDTTMDIDLDDDILNRSTSSVSDSSTRPAKTEFEKYLLERFTLLPRIKEIIELVAERCGFSFDSDDEFDFDQRDRNRQAFSSEVASTKASPIHWRRVKPVTLPTKQVKTSGVKSTSALGKIPFRFNSVGKQVELPSAPAIASNRSRRNSEPGAKPASESDSAVTVIPPLNTTPTKSTKTDSDLVILETPPRNLATSSRRLFPSKQ